MVLNSVLILVLRLFMAAIAAMAMRAAMRAYSIRSWPESSRRSLWRICIGVKVTPQNTVGNSISVVCRFDRGTGAEARRDFGA